MKKFALAAALGVFFLGLGATIRASAADFSGQWAVPQAGIMTIAQTGNSISGSLSGGDDEPWGPKQQKGGTLEGTVNGSTAQCTTKTGDGNTSTVTLTLAADGKSFGGKFIVTAGPLKGSAGFLTGIRRAAPPAAPSGANSPGKPPVNSSTPGGPANPGSNPSSGKQEDLAGNWTRDNGNVTQITQQGNQYSGTLLLILSPQTTLFKVGELTLRNVVRTGPNTFKGEVLRRFSDKPEEWESYVFTVAGDHMTANPPDLGNFVRKSGKCPETIAGTWLGPISGRLVYQVSGLSVTGSVANLGGKYGAATITGTLSGKTTTGTWKSAKASGKITVTGPNANCVTQITYTVDNPAGPGGNETLTQPPGGASPTNVASPTQATGKPVSPAPEILARRAAK